MIKKLKKIIAGSVIFVLALLLLAVGIALRLKLDIPALISAKTSDEIFIDVPYKTVDGRQLRLDIYKPRKVIFTETPVVFMLHGGGWDSGSKQLKDEDVLAAFLDYGVTIVSVEYRLTDSETVFPAHIDDCADAVRFTAENATKYGLDKNRFCVLGSSAGGQLSLLLALAGGEYGSGGQRGQELPIRCAVSLCGPTDFLNLEGYTRQEQEEVDRLLKDLFGGSVKEKETLYREASPINRLRKDAPPIFLAHGTKDNIVQFSQAQSFYHAAVETGMKITYVPVENANHKFKAAGEEPISPALDKILNKLAIFLVKNLII